MANIKSAIKRVRTTATKTAQNKARTSRVRTFLKKVEEAVQSGDAAAAQTAFQAAQPELQRSNLHKNTVARRLSRLSAQIATLKGKTPGAKAKAKTA